MTAHQPLHDRAGESARARAAELAAAGRNRRRAMTAAVASVAGLGGLTLGGWDLAAVGALWGAGGALLWQWRTDPHRTWLKGAAGERRTGRLLDPLRKQGYVVLHDRAIPRSRANIDHIVVTPGAQVVVVDSKNWSKDRLVKGRGRRLRIGRVSGRTVVKSVRWEARRVGEELARDLPGERITVLAVLAVHGARLPTWRPLVVDGIPILPAKQVPRWIAQHTATPDPAGVGLMGEALERLFPRYQDRADPGGTVAA